MVTTSVRVLNGVHGNTSNSGPAVALNLVLVVLVTGLHDGLVNSATTSDHTNHSSAGAVQSLSGTRGKSDSGLAAILGVTDDDSTATGGLGQSTAITNLGLEVANYSTLGNLADWENVTDGKLSALTAVDELTTVHALSSNEVSLDQLVLVGISEVDSGNGSTSAGIVDDFSNDTLDIAVSLSEVVSSELGGTLSVSSHSLEDARTTLTLSTNYSSHK